ncbi:MAG: membrane lipoprotein lipid attachment site-containing protein [Oscillibacter sp.]|nr:membrane lipoprotein lipid attachment site-containing protein [Oscillibacter sp.]
MKRLIVLALMLLILSGCAAREEPKPTVPSSTPPATEEPAPPPTEPEPPTPITAESLREEYEAAGFTIREIVPYEGDFLIHYGSEPYNSMFQWVYTNTGLHAPLLFSGREVLDYEISHAGCIRVLEGGNNIYNNAAQAFPVYECAFASLPVSAEGNPLTDYHASGNVQQETYWAPLDISHTFGWGHGQVALVDVRVTTQGVEAVFGPTADNIGGFFAAASGIPVTEPVYDEASHTLTLRFRETSLASGQRTEFTSESDQWAYEDLASVCHLPTSFPAGTVAGSNEFISSAEVREDRGDILLILTLTEAAQQYTAETGQLLQNESRPYLQLSLRENRLY